MNTRNVPWWGIVSSAASPVVLAAAWTIPASRPAVSIWVTVILLSLVAWFGLELITSAGLDGVAERVLGEAQAVWPFVVVMSCRHPVTVTARYRLLHECG
jgi:hypothetical protein